MNREFIGPSREHVEIGETAEQLGAEAEEFLRMQEELRAMAASEAGRNALRLAGVPEVMIEQEVDATPDALNSIETGLGRAAIGGL